MLTTPSRRSILLICVGFTLAACGTNAKALAPTPTPTPSATALPPTPTPTATPVPAPTPALLAAPVMIQVENLWAARPQSGLNQADVIYEYQTEGGISRFSALFFKVPAGNVGPVRSARLVTIKLLRVWGATLLYSGASNYVANALSGSGLRQFNETRAAGALFRVSSRFAPHNLYTDGSHLAAFEQRVGPQTVGWQLWPGTALADLPPGASQQGRFQVPISQSERPIFTYDGSNGRYTRTEPDTGLLTDANSGAPWRPSTIAVLQTSITVGPEVEDVSGTHGLDFKLVGSGAGQLAVGGKLYPIIWNQPDLGPPQLTLTNGQAAPIVPGPVLIELVPPGGTVVPR